MNATLSKTLPDLAAGIDQAHGQAVAAAGVAIEHALRCGELLMEAKARIGHGGFLDWLGKNCTVAERQARNYVKLARNWPTIQAKSEPGSVLTVKGALRLIGRTSAGTDRTAPGTAAGLPEGFEPQPGKYLRGQHRVFEHGLALVAESAKHPGYWHVYLLDGRPTPDGNGADFSTLRPILAQHLAGMFHHLLQNGNERPEAYEWMICDAHGCDDGYPGKFVDDMADAIYYHANFWWLKGRKGARR